MAGAAISRRSDAGEAVGTPTVALTGRRRSDEEPGGLCAHAARLVGIGGFRCREGEAAWTAEAAAILRLPANAPEAVASLLAAFPEPERARLARLLAGAARGIAFDEEIARDPDAEPPVWVRIAGEPDPERPGGMRGAVEDVSRRRDQERTLWTLANIDDLTGLWNRKRLGELLEIACAGSRAGLLLIDLDRLKEVNDTLGHGCGDGLIRTVAARIKSVLEPGQEAARLGGDEFGVVFLEGADEAGLAQVAARIIAACEAPLRVPGGHTLIPSVSIGGALARDGAGPERLRGNADIALYEAKASGRGRFVPFCATIRTALINRHRAVRDAGAFIERGAVVPRYMPVVRLSDRLLCGFEALARFVDEDGEHSPARFSSALVDARIGHQLTTRMLACVAADLAAFASEGTQFDKIGLNVTLADFQRGDLEERIARAFGEAGVPQDKLVVEVTEQVFLSGEADCVARTAARLREKGIRISLDDFGTGFASLTHLRTFPLDTIKVDRSFVSRITDDEASLAIVGGLIDLAGRLSIDLVAEGIETRAQFDLLRRLGCPFGQGYIFAPPLDPAATAAFVRACGARMRTPLAA